MPRLLLLPAGMLLATVLPAAATIYQVDRTDDDATATACTAAANDCSLRGAIIASNTHVGADTINVPAGTYNLTIAGRAEDAAATGDLDITDDLTITGAGAATTIVDGGGLDRVFHVDPAGTGTITVTIQDLTVQNGNSVVIAFVLANGGAIRNGTSNTASTNGAGTLIVKNCVVRNSSTERQGGGIANAGTLQVIDSVISGNSAGTIGGGIMQEDTGSATISGTTVSGNHADFQSGGGLFMGVFSITADPVVVITDSTFSGNTAQSGGGIFQNRGTLTMTNSTISGNSATTNGGGSGGIVGNDKGTLRNCTITDNHAPNGSAGGISSSSMVLSNTIVAGNTAFSSPDCTGTINGHGYNLIGNTQGCSVTGDQTGDVTGTAPLLGPLANNGGLTQTHQLLNGSPALDTGNPATPGSNADACPTTDQIGTTRPHPLGGRCDIGAVESLTAVATTTTTSSTSTTTTSTTTTTTHTTTTSTTTSTTHPTTTSTTTSSTVPTTTTSSTTVVTTIPTTTTTLPGVCADETSFAAILCRLDQLIAHVDARGDLGRLKPGLLRAVKKARKQAQKAADSPTKTKTVTTQLKNCAKSLQTFAHKLDSNNAHKIIPSDTQQELTTEAGGIGATVVALRATF